jgi:hypothetical protein
MDNVPHDSLKNMYSRLSGDDIEALANDKLNDLSDDGANALLTARDYIHSKRLMGDLKAQQQELQNPTQGWRGAARNVAGVPLSLLTGIARGTTGIANLPANIVNQLTGKQSVPTIPKPADLASAIGDEPSGVAESLGSFIPSAIGGEALAGAKGLGKLGELFGIGKPTGALGRLASPTIRSQAASGALYGASQNPQDMKSSAIAGALLGGGLGAAAEYGIPAVSRGLISLTPNVLARKAGQMMGSPQGAGAIQSALGDAFKEASDKAKDWEKTLLPVAKGADMSGVPFDSSYFVNKAKKMLEKMQPKIKDIPEKYKDAQKELQGMIDEPPTSYEHATRYNEKINSIPKTWSNTNDASQEVLQKLSSKMGKVLKEQVDMNAQNSPVATYFSNLWREQRENYKRLKSFSSAASKMKDDGTPELQYSPAQAKKIGVNPDADIANHFLPASKSKKSTAQMYHLANLLGNKEKAAQALKQDYMAEAFKNGDFNPKIALNKYDMLSDEQRKFMFTPSENRMFSSALKAKNIANNSSILNFLKNQSAGAVLGASIGSLSAHERGENPITGAAIGAIGIPALGAMLARSTASPEMIAKLERAIQPSSTPRRAAYPALAGLSSALLGGK